MKFETYLNKALEEEINFLPYFNARNCKVLLQQEYKLYKLEEYEEFHQKNWSHVLMYKANPVERD